MASLGVRVWLRAIMGSTLLAGVCFLPAGRLDWIEGWFLMGTILVAVGVTAAWLKRHDPELLAERATRRAGAKRWDLAILAVYGLLSLAELALASLDSGRHGWSAVPGWTRAAGWLAFAAGMALVVGAMAVNTFASEVVRIQRDRGHRTVTAGPYRFVRHPMYVGVLLIMPAIALMLGSWWALIPAGAIAVLFVLRTALEDRTLRRELDGYEAYAGRVRYRLLPFVW